MRAILSTIVVAAACHVAAAQASQEAVPAEASPIETVARSAEAELARSVEQLNALRDQIAKEKLPLAEELTALEDKLAQLRRDFEKTVRLVDSGKLELTTITAEIKKRQDELTYVGNILDEYAKTFDAKVNPAEMLVLAPAIDDAKQAAENKSLTAQQRLAKQVGFVDMTITRLGDAIGGLKFAGVGVNLDGGVVNGEYAILGPVALFKGESGGAAGVVVPQADGSKPLIRPLEGPLQAGLASIVSTGEGLLPLDASRGGALKELVQKTNLIHIFEKGGPIMWPLLAASVLALGAVLERTLFLMRERWRRSPRSLERFFIAVSNGDLDGAKKIAAGTKFYVVRVLGYALNHREQSIANALVYAQGVEMRRFRRGISILDTVITLAPLLGLLGTVTGMMGSFSLIGGELSAPGAITGGIAEALIATAFGLGIAIVSLIPYNMLNTKMEEARHEMESASAQFELMMEPRERATASQQVEGKLGQLEWAQL